MACRQMDVGVVGERVRPVVLVLGQTEDLQEELAGGWASEFRLNFRSHYDVDEAEDEQDDMSNMEGLVIPSYEWLKGWLEERPSVVVDILEPAAASNASEIVECKKKLKAKGLTYLPTTYSALGELLPTVKEASKTFYKERAKQYRKRVTSSSYPSVVWYNSKAGWMEELAGDHILSIRSFHVAYSALLQSLKEAAGADNVPSAVLGAADVLACKIVSGMASTGGVTGGGGGEGRAVEADAYLWNHHKWAKPFRGESSNIWQMANYLAVADSFSQCNHSHLIPGRYYLLAVECGRQVGGEMDPAFLHSLLSRAHTSYSQQGRPMRRHLTYISLLSASLSNGQLEECVRRVGGEDGWRDAARMILAHGEASLATRWTLMSAEDLFNEDLPDESSAPPLRVEFGRWEQTRLSPLSTHVLHPDSIRVAFCNMSPLPLTPTLIRLSLHSHDQAYTVSIPCDGTEIVPGAHRLWRGDFGVGAEVTVRVVGVEVEFAGGWVFSYSPEALSTADTVMDEWSRPFRKLLGTTFTERSKTRPGRPPILPQPTCHRPTPITNSPCPITFHPADDQPISIRITSSDGGKITGNDSAEQSSEILLHVTWTSPGHKTLIYETTNGKSTRTDRLPITILDPLHIHFPTSLPVSPDQELVVVADVRVQLDGLQLGRWDVWDAVGGGAYEVIKNTTDGDDCYRAGDVVRVGFRCPAGAAPVLQSSWQVDGQSGRMRASCPTSLTAPLHGLSLSCSSPSKSHLGQPLPLRWTLQNHSAQTIRCSARLPAPDHPAWIVEGPCAVETEIGPDERFVLDWTVVPMVVGMIPVPALEIAASPTTAIHTFPLPTLLIIPSP